MAWVAGAVGILCLAGGITLYSRTETAQQPSMPTMSNPDPVRKEAFVSTPASAVVQKSLPKADVQTAGKFAKCVSYTRVTCVVDGDTFWFEGTKIRLVDIDTPEISEPKCTDELNLGLKATGRLIELLNEGPFELVQAGDRDQDRYGRALRQVSRHGKSLGETLIAEGLAHRWVGHKEPWC